MKKETGIETRAHDRMDDVGDARKSPFGKLAIILVVLSFLFYGIPLVIPFLSLSVGQKAVAISVCIVLGEVSWWTGVAILGKQAISKYRKFLNPCNWFK